MSIKILHTSDIHLGKTYRTSTGEAERYDDFFYCLGGIVTDAIEAKVDFVLIGGDLFHVGQILPKTFAKTIETLQPLKDANIPCIAIKGNHDWIHRRDNISWMEALSQTKANGYNLNIKNPNTVDDALGDPELLAEVAETREKLKTKLMNALGGGG